MTDERITVDLGVLTMAELADALDASGVADMANATAGEQVRLTAAFAWLTRRRTDPAFTYDDALALPMGAIVVEGETPGEVVGALNGAPPLESAARGELIPES